MIRQKQGEVEWLEFELLAEQPNLVHGVFLRHGGVSEGAFGSLNAGGLMGDEPEKIVENRRRILQALNIEQYVAGTQVHGNNVACVNQADQEPGECDAIITQLKGLGLMMKHADCQVAIVYDPIQHALANVHSGWRGNVKNIYRETILNMQRIFHSKPENLLVGISPSLGPQHAEFKHYEREFPKDFWRFQIRPTYFDLWAIARDQLEQSGVLPHHIQIAGICTYTNTQDYFSYRREKISGRHATMAMLK
jgi:YfiH family protein